MPNLNIKTLTEHAFQYKTLSVDGSIDYSALEGYSKVPVILTIVSNYLKHNVLRKYPIMIQQ